MKNITLPEFQEFLRSRSLVHQNYIPFYAYWASKFLTFSNNNENLNHELRIEKFLDQLKVKAKKNIADWQVQQADEALRIYIYGFLDKDKAVLYPNAAQAEKKLPEVSKLISELKQAIRIRHYSYSTERTYIDWVKRFFNYIMNEKKKGSGNSGILETPYFR